MKLTALIRPTLNAEIEAIYNAYLALREQDQAILTILAVVYKPLGITKLTQLTDFLADSGFLPMPKKEYRLLVSERDTLVKNGLLSHTKEGLQINRLLANRLCYEIENLVTLPSLTAHQKLLEILTSAEEIAPVLYSHSWQSTHTDNRRITRDFYFLQQLDLLENALAINKNPQIINHDKNRILLEILFIPFDFERFIALPTTLQYQAFATLFRVCQMQGQSCEYATALLEKVCAHNPDHKNPNYNWYCHHLLAEQYLYQLRFKDFKRLVHFDDNSCYGLQLLATYQFLLGDNQQAIEYFEKAIVAKNKIARRKNQYLNELLGYFYKLALIVQAHKNEASGFAVALGQIEAELNDRKVNSDFYNLSMSLNKPIMCMVNANEYQAHIQYNTVSEDIDFFCHHLSYLNHLLAQYWCNETKTLENTNIAEQHQAKFAQLGYSLFAQICGQLATNAAPTQAPNTSDENTSLLVDFTTLITPKSKWEVALEKLIALNPNKPEVNNASAKTVPTKPIRLIWELIQGYEHSLQPREQKLNTSGWSKGRVVSLKRLHKEYEFFDYLSPSDKRICQAIMAYEGWGYYSKTEYALQGLSALNAAIGIDNLYTNGDYEVPIEIIKREPELLVTQQGDQLCMSIADLDHDIDDDSRGRRSAYNFKRVSDTQYQLTVFSDEHIKVANIIGEGGLLVPISAKQKALDGISAIAPFLNIQSDISELDTGLENHECDPNLVVNIQPEQSGLSFTCVVMPFGETGPAFKPATGNASLSTELNGKRVATVRDLLREETLLDALDTACPAFLDMPNNVLLLDDIQSALSALEQLEAAVTSNSFALKLRWPKGKKITLSKPLDSAQLQLAFSKKSEWFDITGDLKVSDELVVDLRKLLELVRTSNGRFIELGAQQILALSDDLRHRLEQISQVTDNGTFHPLASLQMEEATTGMRMKTIHAWDTQTAKMHEANTIVPKIPSTFQAQLRDYQQAGFDWAMRLAHWGAGACLADDMGLGKTLQALAVMLARANKGPSLVIAPTSVCFNWQQEALKFAPTLNVKLFADSSNTLQREDMLNSVGEFDCIIISYGLLQRESDILKQVRWHTIVADEAQAIKNPLAKRTKAAYALKGDFKMITTGTPIENDLTELWSLFRFINPGLLGNVKRFGQRFSLPIADAEQKPLEARKASQALKALIAPFMLRRMKNQVLTELPPRTEINIPVHMSEKEYAFYEALRLNAIDNISQSGQQANAGEQRIRMLAELVKLRQACCNPKLVMAETDIPSAKLQALNQLLTELKLNKHKALIFSQFVGHLQLIKQQLDEHGFSYQYLDGSTPQKERQKRVNAFQSGEGDIFLISLKAGGSGLNLTAADYVIHMDPWWNPAVEDQASDRAHRMGQKRPVTIYRLITQHTIEEKIVALHQQKRDLADTLLAGNEIASKLSVEDMLNLLKETF